MERWVVQGPAVYGEEGVYQNGCVVVEDGVIAALYEDRELKEECHVISFPNDYVLIPGMIDIHIHGVGGADVMDGTVEALRTMSASLPKEGTTSFLATTITEGQEAMEQALQNAARFMKRQAPGQAELVGIHLEGPFLNKKRAGAQPLQHISPPDIALFQKWQTLANSAIRIVTLAPEEEGGLELVAYLHQHGVIPSIGHSDASYEEVNAAIGAGASHVTHLFNGMRGLHHREPGLLGAALLRDELMTEVIADGIHSHPDMVRLAFKQKGAGRTILITDAMRAKGLPDGVYKLGGQSVNVRGKTALLSDGTLAGSVLRMNEAVRNMIMYTGCSLREAIEMACENPARRLGVFHRKGSITAGKDADLVVLDEKMDVVMTWCKGKLAYDRMNEQDLV